MQKTIPIKPIVYLALFTALIIVGARLSFPFPGTLVPVTLANLFVVLAGLILGPLWGLASVILYLLLGVIGIPVFAKTQGLAVFLGPTGGFLIGYVLGVVIAGFVSGAVGKKEPSGIVFWVRAILASLLAFAAIYIPGVLWFAHITGKSLAVSLVAACYPFLLPDLAKAVVAVFLVPGLRRLAY